MRLIYIVTAADFGGATVHVLHLMEADIQKEYTVGLVSAPEPRLLLEARRMGVRLFVNRYFVRPVQIWNDIRALVPVFRAIKAFEPDLLSAHSTKAGYAARLAGFILRKPVIFTAHGWSFTEGRRMWKRQLLAFTERLAARVTTKIVCVSEHDRNLALKFNVAPPEKIVVVHNGVDPASFLSVDGASIREKFSLEKVPVLTMVGRMASPKDFITLLEALRQVEGNYRLLIVGDGELRKTVEHLIAEKGLAQKVILTGQRKDIPEILAASDIFVLSSRWEGLPYTIIEAMMAGLPVVATSVGGVPELVEAGITGFLVPREDPEALAEAIRKLLADADLRWRMGQAGREKALREFSLNRMLAQTQEVYEEVVRQRRIRD